MIKILKFLSFSKMTTLYHPRIFPLRGHESTINTNRFASISVDFSAIFHVQKPTSYDQHTTQSATRGYWKVGMADLIEGAVKAYGGEGSVLTRLSGWSYEPDGSKACFLKHTPKSTSCEGKRTPEMSLITAPLRKCMI